MSSENEPLLTKEELEKKYKEEKGKVDQLLKEGKYEEALNGYNELIKTIEKQIKQNKSIQKEEKILLIKQYMVPLYSNLCFINIKQNDFNSVINNANFILKIEKDNTKAIYRKCYAEINLSEYEKAEETMDKLRQLIGEENHEMKSLRKLLDQKKTEDNLKKMKKYKKMMNYYHKLNEEKEYQEMSKIGKFFYGCNEICKKIFCCCNKRKTIKKTY